LGNLSNELGNVSNKVGDLLPKGRVGDSRLESVFGWQFVLAYRLANPFPSEHRFKLPIGNATFRRKVAYLIRKVSYRLVGNVSNEVGDFLPKSRVGDSQLELLFGRQSDSNLFGNTNFRPNTELSRLFPT
jgi:hypothetical protein